VTLKPDENRPAKASWFPGVAIDEEQEHILSIEQSNAKRGSSVEMLLLDDFRLYQGDKMEISGY